MLSDVIMYCFTVWAFFFLSYLKNLIASKICFLKISLTLHLSSVMLSVPSHKIDQPAIIYKFHELTI